jgi:hypothetical protein
MQRLIVFCNTAGMISKNCSENGNSLVFCDLYPFQPYQLQADLICATVYHRERILETSTLSCNEEEEEITKPPKR